MKKISSLPFLLLFGLASVGLGDTFYVAPDGNNTAAGTLSAPWRDVYRAGKPESGFQAGDTLIIRGGVYPLVPDEPIHFNGLVATNEPTTIRPMSGETVILDGGLNGENHAGITVSGCSNLVIQDIVIRDVRSDLVQINNGSTHVTISGCRLDDAADNGLLITDSSDLLISQCTITNVHTGVFLSGCTNSRFAGLIIERSRGVVSTNGVAGGHGFFVQYTTISEGLTVEDCVVRYGDGDGFNFHEAGQVSLRRCWSLNNGIPASTNNGNGWGIVSGSRTVIENCIVADNRVGGIRLSADEGRIDPPGVSHIRNSVIHGNGQHGVVAAGDFVVQILNSIMTSNATLQVVGATHRVQLLTHRSDQGHSGVPGIFEDFNVFQGHGVIRFGTNALGEGAIYGPEEFTNGDYAGLVGSNFRSIIADPRFVDAAAHDFRLRVDSPAIDSGRPTGAPEADLVDQTRFDVAGIDNTGLLIEGAASFVDRGAYEFVPPALTMERDGSFVRWPVAPATDFVLEHRFGLETATPWQVVQDLPSLDNGFLQLPAQMGFYRLRAVATGN